MNNIHTVIGNKTNSLQEKRLLYRMANPEAAPSAEPQVSEQREAPASDAVGARQAQSRSDIQETLGRMQEQRANRPPRTTVGQHLSNARAALPSTSTTVKGIATAGVVANPIVGVPVVAGAVAAGKTWGFLRKIPGFKQVDGLARGAGRLAKNGAIAAVTVATTPFHGSLHLTKAAGEFAYQAYDNTIGEFFRDISAGISAKHPGMEDINIFSAAVIGLKKAVTESVKFPFTLAGKAGEGLVKVASNLADKPIRTAVGTSIAIAAITNPALVFPILEKVVGIFQSIVSAIPGI